MDQEFFATKNINFIDNGLRSIRHVTGSNEDYHDSVRKWGMKKVKGWC